MCKSVPITSRLDSTKLELESILFCQDTCDKFARVIFCQKICKSQIIKYCNQNKYFKLPRFFYVLDIHSRQEAATGSVLQEKMFLKFSENSQGNTCAIASFLTKLQASDNFVKKETLTHVFSFDFCEIFKNTIFTEHLRATPSGNLQ